VYNVFGLWLSEGFVLPPDVTDSPKQSVFMKLSRAAGILTTPQMSVMPTLKKFTN
jgi:hypothetical protein